jgi:hypothetical protein
VAWLAFGPLGGCESVRSRVRPLGVPMAILPTFTFPRERRCDMSRLRLVVATVAVAVLVHVGTAGTALAGLTATGVD